MTGTFLSRVQGFTPVIDVLCEEMGLAPAAVYGVIWRYCQGPRGVCQASLETIGAHLGLNWRTVLRHIKHLVNEGYLEDLTPDLRNHPHTYADAGRAEIEGLVQARVHRRALSNCHSAPCQNDRATPPALSKWQCDTVNLTVEDTREEIEERREEGDAATSAAVLANRLWLAARDVLKTEFPPATYNTWVKDSRAVSLDGGVLVIGVQSAYAKDWLENRLYSQVQRTVTEIRGHPTSIRFIIRRNSR
jgi:DNA-binding MarR family transcriptional regulator